MPGNESGTGPTRTIPHVFFHDEDFYDDYVDMDDIFDNDMDTGERMVVMPSNWTSLTLQDVNGGVYRRML